MNEMNEWWQMFLYKQMRGFQRSWHWYHEISWTNIKISIINRYSIYQSERLHLNLHLSAMLTLQRISKFHRHPLSPLHYGLRVSTLQPMCGIESQIEPLHFKVLVENKRFADSKSIYMDYWFWYGLAFILLHDRIVCQNNKSIL